MPIRKLLIAPAARLTTTRLPLWQRLKGTIREPARLYDGELLFYADIPQLLGQSNTYILGELHHHLHDTAVPDNCPYPSCHGTPQATPITVNQLFSTIKHVDAVLLSNRSPFLPKVIQLARQHDKPIAILDFPDHEDLYGTQPTYQQIYRGLKLNSDFDLYFKKDLIPRLANETTLPLEPAPVRPSSYQIPHLPITSPIFYSGRSRMDTIQPDRAESVALVKQHFPQANIIEHDDRSSFLTTDQYWQHLSTSNLALSPSGRIWGSFRHCETGLTPHTALIAPKPYIATVGIPLQDGVNAILYDVEAKNGRYHLINSHDLIDKINYYLTHKQKLQAIATQWRQDVLAAHTVTTRSQYILDATERLL